MSLLVTLVAASVVANVPPAHNVDSLDEVVITAGAFRRRIADSVQPVTVLSGDALQQQGTASLGETLSGLPGIHSTWFGPVASRPIIRGMGGSRIQMLEDGLPSPDASSLSDDHAVAIEPSLAEQIEVLRGPAALLFGSTASGGVINVVTNRLPERKSDEPFKWDLAGRFDSTLGERSVDHQLRYTHDDFNLNWAFAKRRTSDVEAPEGQIKNTASDSYSGSFAGTKFFDTGSLGVAIARLASTYGPPGTDTSFIDLHEDTVNLRGIQNFDGTWFDRASIRMGFGRYEHTEFEAAGLASTRYGNDQQEARIALERIRAKGTSVVIGVQFGEQKFSARGDEAFVPTSTTRTAAAFGTAALNAGRFDLELGIRADHQSVRPDSASRLPTNDGNALSASAGVLWRATDTGSGFLNVTHTTRLPQPTELYADGVHGALNRIEIGNSTLAREIGRTVDLGWRFQNNSLEWSIASFFNRYRDYTYIDPTGETDSHSGLPIFRYRQAPVEFFGAEGSFGRTWALGDARRLRVHGSADIVRGQLRDGGDLPAIPAARVALGAHLVNDIGSIGFDVQRVFSQSRIAPNETPTPGFTLVSVDLNRDFEMPSGKLAIFVRGTNLLNETARVHSSALKDVMPLPGRGIKIGFNWGR